MLADREREQLPLGLDARERRQLREELGRVRLRARIPEQLGVALELRIGEGEQAEGCGGGVGGGKAAAIEGGVEEEIDVEDNCGAALAQRRQDEGEAARTHGRQDEVKEDEGKEAFWRHGEELSRERWGGRQQWGGWKQAVEEAGACIGVASRVSWWRGLDGAGAPVNKYVESTGVGWSGASIHRRALYALCTEDIRIPFAVARYIESQNSSL